MVAAAVILSGLFLTVVFTGAGTSSPQPTPFCSVCGATFHENVTASAATLQMTASGDVRWTVENKVAEPTASNWEESPERARGHVETRLDDYGPPQTVNQLSVEMENDTMVIEFVDTNVARHRIGLLILPYLNGEGIEARYVINAERLTIVAPDGQRVINNPQLATVEGDRVIWEGFVGDTPDLERVNAPEPGDTYVITGSGPTAEARSSIAVLFEPLDPTLYTRYVLGLLFFTGLPFSIYTVHDHRMGSRRVMKGLALVVVPYLLMIAAIHPPKGGLGGFVIMVGVAMLSLILSIISGVLLYLMATWAAEDQP